VTVENKDWFILSLVRNYLGGQIYTKHAKLEQRGNQRKGWGTVEVFMMCAFRTKKYRHNPSSCELEFLEKSAIRLLS
jgi:hypothetical protein